MTFTASHRSSYVLLLAPLFFLLLLSSVSDMMLFDDDGLEIVRNRACLLIRTELGSDVGWLENKFLLSCSTEILFDAFMQTDTVYIYIYFFF